MLTDTADPKHYQTRLCKTQMPPRPTEARPRVPFPTQRFPARKRLGIEERAGRRQITPHPPRGIGDGLSPRRGCWFFFARLRARLIHDLA